MSSAGTRKLTISIDGTEYAAEVSEARVASRPSENDNPTFAETAAGGQREYYAALTLLQDHAATSVWRKVWEEAGTEVPVIVRPYGNAVATVAQPHYSGTVTIVEPDGDLIGGQANASTTSRWTIGVEWVFTAKPTEITA